MFLVIDIGNTNIVLGIFDHKNLIKKWRIQTDREITGSRCKNRIEELFTESEIKSEDIMNTIISSVVPEVKTAIDSSCENIFGYSPHWVDILSCPYMPVLYDNPSDLGADRIVNAVAAFEKYRQDLIIIDFGTATTFDAVSQKGEYLGGAIAPGIMISSDALFEKASKLPRITLTDTPEKAIGKNTLNSMKSGIIFGYAGLVDGMVDRLSGEMGAEPKVVATGGLAGIMKNISRTIESVEPDLTLQGLRIIGEKLADI